MAFLMEPASAHDQKCAEHSGKHAGILSCFDVAEDASDEAAYAAEESDGEKDDASQNEDVGDWSVGEMIHKNLPVLNKASARWRTEDRPYSCGGEASYGEV